MSNKEIKELDFDIKMKIWIHYMVNQLSSIHVPLELDLRESMFEKSNSAKIYPRLGIYTFSSGFNLGIVRDFETFCNEPDDRVSGGLLGYYYRFNTEIFK
jgi:hypothetical protein